MSAGDAPVLRATALQVAAALARYELHVNRLVVAGLDCDLYATASEEIEEIKLFCAEVPAITVAWAALLVSHADLVHSLWRSASASHPHRAREEVTRRLEEHVACVDVVARRCLRIAERNGGPVGRGQRLGWAAP